MKVSKKIIAGLAITALAVVLVLWRVGIFKPAGKVSKGADEKGTVAAVEVNEPNAPAELGDSNEPDRAEDANEPERRRGRGGRRAGRFGRRDRDRDPNDPNDLNDPNDPNDSLEALNLKEVQMKDIIRKLAEWSGKVVIPDDEAMKQKLTIYSAEKLPREDALELIYMALRAKGYVAEESGRAIYIKPIAKALIGSVPTITEDYPLASISNKSQVVTKIVTEKYTH